MGIDKQLEVILQMVNTAGSLGVTVYAMYILAILGRCLIFFGGLYSIVKVIIECIKWHALQEAAQREVKSKG